MTRPTLEGVRAHRFRRSLHGDTVVLVALLGLYLVARLLSLRGLEPFTSFDSGSYAPRPGVTAPFDFVSLTGDAPRPWGVPLLYALVGSDTARVVLQWLVGTAAWSLLVVGLWVSLRTSVARVVAAIVVIALALTAPASSWDVAILSESLSISLGVAALGLLALWARTASPVAAAALAGVGVWWVFTRPDVLPFAAVLTAVMIGYAALRPERRRAAALVAGALVLGVAWYAATVPRTDEAFREWGYHLGLSESTFVYRLRLQVYPDAEVLQAYTGRFGMPDCPPATAAAGRTDWEIERFVAAYRSCPSLVTWVDREKGTVAVRYALAEPSHFVRLTLDALPGLLGGAAYARPAEVLPGVVDDAWFPPLGWVLRGLLGAVVVAVAAAVASGAFRQRPWLALAGAALVVVSAASAVVGSLYSAGEYGRFGIQEAILLRVGLILLVVAALDALLERRRGTNERFTPAGGT